MSGCDRIKELLGQYLDGELDAIDHNEVVEHLAGCAACSRDLESLRQISYLLKEEPHEHAPSDFLDRVNTRLGRQKELDSVLKRIMKNSALKIPVALVVVCICVVAVFKTLEVNAPMKMMVQKGDETTAVIPASPARETGGILRQERENGMRESFALEERKAVQMKREPSAALMQKEMIGVAQGGLTAISEQRLEVTVKDLRQGITAILTLLEKLNIPVIAPLNEDLRKVNTENIEFLEFAVKADGRSITSFLDELEKTDIADILVSPRKELDRYQSVVLHIRLHKKLAE
ncbi:MAG: zf-HC2 domain-containing protein [Candidatus Omnitrophica bacterium]|nr:zf-HC2 domain-containing protein [Candidatus Omnitrophota bacterium]